jgi:murein hydrolase activator
MRLIVGFIFLSQVLLAATENSVQKQVALKQNKLMNIELKQQALIQDLISINKKIKSQATKLGDVQKETETITAEIDKQKSQIKSMSKQLVESKKRLTAKIKAISKIKSGNLLQIALVHSNLADIEKSMKLMGIVASYDVQYINDYYEKKIALGQDLKKLDSRYQALQDKKALLAQQQVALERESKLRAAWLEQVKKNKVFTQAEISKIRKNKNNAMLEDLGVFDIFSKETIVKNKGQLAAPVDGIVTQKYGVSATDDSVLINNSGVFFSANASEGIKALFNAEVVFVGSMDSLGNVVVLDHGDNYYSVYGNLKSVAIKSKDIVHTGQIIAQSDYSPLYGTNGLYFEMRHYSQSLNPKNWIRSFHENN